MKEKVLSPAIMMPSWLQEIELKKQGKAMTDEEKVLFAIMLANENVRKGNGGPFGAAVFDIKTDQLIAVGVNSVVSSGQSWAHAEMTALANAQKKLGCFDLKGYIIAASCEPCAMCFGAIPWSGVEMLIYGAPGEVACEAGFDEGSKVKNWHESLECRNIKVVGPMFVQKAKEPFDLYRSVCGKIY